MRVAGENAEELTAFLEKDDNPDRKKLLDSLTKKDNKDLRAEVLEDHLSAKRGSWSEDIHVQDLLCPRIWLEEIGAYRSYICSVLTAQEQGSICLNPELIWNYVNQNITDIPEEEYDTLLRVADRLSEAENGQCSFPDDFVYCDLQKPEYPGEIG